MTLGVQVHLLTSCNEYAQLCYEMYAYVTQQSYKLIKVYINDTRHLLCSGIFVSWILECRHLTLAITMLNNIVPLHTQNAKLSSQACQCATLNV
jgi:hypothetical protein